MKNHKKLIVAIVAIISFFLSAMLVFAAPPYTFQKTVVPEITDTYYLGSTSPNLEWKGVYTKNLTVTGSCTGCGGGGSPGGANTNVQINDSGAFGGAANFSYTKSNGFVGIGTTTPNDLLHIVRGGADEGITIESTDTTYLPRLRLKDTFGEAFVGLAQGSNVFFGDSQNGDFAFRAATGGRIIMGVDDGSGTRQSSLLLSSNGYVGVNTTDPQYPLQVAIGTITPGGFGGSPTVKALIADQGGSNYTQLAIQGDYGAAVQFYDAAGNPSADFGVDVLNGSGLGFINRVDGTPINFYTDNVGAGGNLDTRMTVLANGNIGIGTISPQGILDVNGNDSYFGDSIGGSDSVRLHLWDNASGIYHTIQQDDGQIDIDQNINISAGNDYLINNVPLIGSQWTTTGSDIFYTTGKVGIGTSTPDSNLDVNGTVRFEGVSSIVTASISGAIVGLGCDSVDTTVSGGLSSTTAFITTPQSYPGDGLNWFSYLLNPTKIRTKVCSDVSVTPNASVYNVKIIK